MGLLGVYVKRMFCVWLWTIRWMQRVLTIFRQIDRDFAGGAMTDLAKLTATQRANYH